MILATTLRLMDIDWGILRIEHTENQGRLRVELQAQGQKPQLFLELALILVNDKPQVVYHLCGPNERRGTIDGDGTVRPDSGA